MNDEIETYVDFLSVYDKNLETPSDHARGLMRDAAVGLAMKIYTVLTKQLHGRARAYTAALRSDAAWTFGTPLSTCRSGGVVVDVSMRLLDHDEFERFEAECRHSALEMLDEVESVLHVCASESGNPDVSAYFFEQTRLTHLAKCAYLEEYDKPPHRVERLVDMCNRGCCMPFIIMMMLAVSLGVLISLHFGRNPKLGVDKVDADTEPSCRCDTCCCCRHGGAQK